MPGVPSSRVRRLRVSLRKPVHLQATSERRGNHASENHNFTTKFPWAGYATEAVSHGPGTCCESLGIYSLLSSHAVSNCGMLQLLACRATYTMDYIVHVHLHLTCSASNTMALPPAAFWLLLAWLLFIFSSAILLWNPSTSTRRPWQVSRRNIPPVRTLEVFKLSSLQR